MWGPDLYIMEKRNEDGSLDLSEPQPPFMVCRESQIFNYYFRNADIPSEQTSATQDEVREWYRKQGFVWRRKTW